jgi:hypothetical protein
MQNHNVFHVSLLNRYTPPVPDQPLNQPPPIIVDNLEEYNVNHILHSKQRYRKLHYLGQWAGYGYVSTSCKPAENFGHAQALVDEFHRNHPRKPQWWLTGINLACIFSFLLSSLIGCGPVHMPLPLVLPPSDHSQVELEPPHLASPQDDHRNYFLFVYLLFCCMQRCSPGGLQL